MSVINPETITQFSTLQGQIWQSVSQAVSEAGEVDFDFGTPLTVSAKLSDIYTEMGSSMLVLQFSFASMPESVQVILMKTESVVSFATALSENPVEEVDDNLLSTIRPQLEAIVQGICMSVGTLRNEPMIVSGLCIRYQAFTTPPNLQKHDDLIQTQVAITAEGSTAHALWLIDELTANLILGTDVEVADQAATPFTQATVPGHAAGASLSNIPFDDFSSIEMLMDIPLEITVELGRLKMLIKDVVDLGSGSIIEIDKAAGEPVDVMVNGRLVAKGEVVVIEDNFGVRITEILSPQERLTRLGEAA